MKKPLTIIILTVIIVSGMVVSSPTQAASESWWNKTKALFQKSVVKSTPATTVPAKPVVVPAKKVTPKPVVKPVKQVKPVAPTVKPVITVKPVEKVEIPQAVPEPVTVTYTRPNQVKVQDIGAYRKVKPDLSNLSFDYSRLLPNGQVTFSKFILIDNENTDFKGYVFENGSEKEYTAPGYIQTNNQKGDWVQVDGAGRVYFESKGKKTRIPTLGGNSVSVADMNEAGLVVGSSSVPYRVGDDDGGSRAFLWQNGVMKNLGALDGSWSRAIAINNKGQVVGAYTIGESDHKTFIYENGVMKRITAEGKDLYDVTDITDSGLILGKFKDLIPNCENRYCLSDVTILDGKVDFLDQGVNFAAVNNSNEFVGTQSDTSVISQGIGRFVGEKQLDIIRRTGKGCAGTMFGRAVVRMQDQTYHLDDIVGDQNIIFECAKNINDRGEILATGFNLADEHDHEYLITIPTQLPKNIKSIAAKSAEIIVPQPEPRDPNKLYALPVPN